MALLVLTFVLKQLLVKDVFSQFVGTEAAEDGGPVGELFDGVHLLRQVVALQEVRQLQKQYETWDESI